MVNIITQITQMVEVGVLVQRKKKPFAYGVGRIENVTGQGSGLGKKGVILIGGHRSESVMVRE